MVDCWVSGQRLQKKKTLITLWFSPNLGRTDENKSTMLEKLEKCNQNRRFKMAPGLCNTCEARCQREPEPTQVRLVWCGFPHSSLGTSSGRMGEGGTEENIIVYYSTMRWSPSNKH